MSGIAAIFNLDGRPADPAILERMLAAIPYRGRDGFGRSIDGPVALGHAMLRTTPESLAEAQPHRDSTGALCLTMDGRVDNRDELRDALISRGFAPREDTDAELVVRAYECFGYDAPAHIVGDFAFAIWDARRREILCARDPLGVKTFYYYFDHGVFLCGSELHQLLEDPRVPREPNEPFIAEILVRPPHGLEETLYCGILRLPPCHALIVSRSGLKRRRYYDLDPVRPIRHSTDAEYAEHYLEIFKEAVRARLRANAPVAADLSGGLDSSSIVCTAHALFRDGEARDTGFETFSLAFTGPESDERAYVEEVVRKWGVRATMLEPYDTDLRDLIGQVEHYRDLPDYANAAMADYRPVFAARPSLRVWLTGRGGDDWVYRTEYEYADLIGDLRLARVASLLVHDWRRYRAARRQRHPLVTLARYGLWPWVPETIRAALRPYMKPKEIPLPVSHAFAQRTGLVSRLHSRAASPADASFAQQDIYRTFGAGWMVHPTEMTERWTAGFGVEGRHPFLDRRLIEFCYAIPDEMRWRPDETKYVMRQAMRDILPEAVRLRRTKAVFSSSYVSALEAVGGARLFSNLAIADNGWVDGDRIAKAYARMLELFRAGDIRFRTYTRPVWMAFALEVWFNVVLLGKMPDAMHVTGQPAVQLRSAG
jgi:asparagine synthase (glutamine-hydrolysing)